MNLIHYNIILSAIYFIKIYSIYQNVERDFLQSIQLVIAATVKHPTQTFVTFSLNNQA